MNEEEYLKKLRKALWVIKSDKRREIVEEIKSDIEERKSSGERIEEILEDMPSPRDVRKEYLEIYGASRLFIVLSSFIAGMISIFTLSVFPFTSILFYPAPLFLIILALFLVYLADSIGRKNAIAASTTSGVLRFLLFCLTIYFVNPPIEGYTIYVELATTAAIITIPLFIKKKKED